MCCSDYSLTLCSLEAIVLRYMSEPLLDDTCLVHPLPPILLQDMEDFDVDGDLYSDVQYPGSNMKKPAAKAPVAAAAPPKPVPIYETTESMQASKKAVGGDAAKGYVKMGYIVKKAKKSKKWKPMFFALLGAKKFLYYFDSNEVVKPKGIIDLPTALVYSVDDSLFGRYISTECHTLLTALRPNCFQIIVNTSEIYLCANTPEEKQVRVYGLSLADVACRNGWRH